MRFKNKLTELVNEIKDSVDELKEITSEVKKSVDEKDISIEFNDGNKRDLPSTSETIKLLEKKIARLEEQMISYFGDKLFDGTNQTTSQPLSKNHLILKNIFELLDLGSLKSCRRVCKYWEEISDSIFRKRVKINLHRFTIEKFMKDFPLESVSCSSFVFSHSICKTSLTHFSHIFRLNSDTMTSLEIDGMDLTDEDGKINSLNIDSFIGPNMKNLKYHKYLNNTQFIITLGRLRNIESLDLKNCVLILAERYSPIEPKEISLQAVSFIREHGDNVINVRLNEFIDFHKCTKIHLDASANTRHNEQIFFKFPSGIKVDSANLKAINISWVPNDNPKIRNLKLDSSELNVRFLTDEIENLCFSLLTETNVENICFNNLKSLTCPTDSQDLLSRLPIFTHCPNLTSVDLQSISGQGLQCNVNWLPHSVKTVTLQSIALTGERFEGKLTSLILIDYHWPSIETILTKLTTDNLYICIPNIVHNNRPIPPVPTEALLRIIQRPFIKLAIGRLIWPDPDNFKKSEISNLVDKRSACYLFENGVGKAIVGGSFDNFIKTVP